MLFLNGNSYVGDWINDTMAGHGIYTFHNRNRYVGELKDGRFHGQGTMTYPDDGVYKGMWENDRRNGRGTMTHLHGESYFGNWLKDHWHGDGTYKWVGGEYTGHFEHGDFNGAGRRVWPNGDIYTGHWHSDAPHGRGILITTSGHRIEGEWTHGALIGPVTWTFGTSSSYVGHVRELDVDPKAVKFDGLLYRGTCLIVRHGPGILTTPQMIDNGPWELGSSRSLAVHLNG